MEILKIKGGNILDGDVEIGGAKNSLVALIPASIITKSVVVLRNVKPIDDTYSLIKILNKLNIKTEYDDVGCLKIDARNIKNSILNNEEVFKLRASYYFMGALLSLYDNVAVGGPGGCNLGERPIDLHLFGFKELGFEYCYVDNVYCFNKAGNRKKEIVFKHKSVGATVNAILASCRIKGKIVIRNCALEPEIDDLISFLNRCGCSIRRKNEDIYIKGVKNLSGCEYTVMPDRIEAGTFMIIGAAMGKEITVKNVNVNHLSSLIEVFRKIGVRVDCKGDEVVVYGGCDKYMPIDVIVDTYPGFPTDLQQPLTVLLSLCNGVSSIKETIYPARLSHVASLNEMGANIVIKDDLIVIDGNRNFTGACVSGKDLRGGISLVIAALIAKSRSEIRGVKYIKRGYSDLVYKLGKLGADVRIESVTDEEDN